MGRGRGRGRGKGAAQVLDDGECGGAICRRFCLATIGVIIMLLASSLKTIDSSMIALEYDTVWCKLDKKI